MNPQQRMKETLEKVGLPYKEIEVYGSQIVITSHCRATAEKWASLIAKFATVRKAALHTVDYAKVNKNTCLLPTTVEVWRTYGVIQ